ncbi:MAG: repeat-containing protein [Planctomycetaceae bacterium]|nr:repeat-containing protein [Planctomycetaceae bacterium]
MVGFSWNNWLAGFGTLVGEKRRKPRRLQNARIEALEDRALLTANLPVAVNDVYAVAQNTTLNGTTVLANDTDLDGDTIGQAQLQSNVSHGTLSLAADGSFTYTPNAGFTGTDSFSYLAIDAVHSETSLNAGLVTIHVGTSNSIPVATPATINATTSTAFHGTLTGTDGNGDPLTFSAGATPATNGSVIINPDGTFTFIPTLGFTGVGSFSFKANDGTANSADATVTVNIGPAGANVAPVATADTIVTPVSTTFNGTLSATDTNGNPLTFTAGTVAATHGTVTINADGTFSYVPTAGFTGVDSFSFKASDGTLTSADTLITAHVGIANALPVVSPITLSTATGAAVSGTLTATDANGDPLTFSAGSTAATHGTVVINPNGTFTFTPTAGFNGVATFSYKANDGIADSADATATVNISASGNVAPVGTAQTISTALNTTFNGTLTATDANGDTLTFAAGTVAAAHGTVTINTDGTFSYVPNAGFTGVDSFSFKASDATLTSANTLVTVHVGVANSLPVVSPVSLSTSTGVAVNGTLTATDANGDPLTFSAGATPATNGTVVINPNGTFTFTPTAGFNGVATFSYKANDGIGNSTDATVTVNVSAAGNVAPVGTAQTISTALNTTFNGTLAATDANGDTLTFAAGTVAAAHGTVTINPNGTFSYVPNAGFTGVDSFSFKASDATLTSANTLVTVHVGVANSLPVVSPVTLSTPLNTNLTGTLTGTDANGDPLTLSVGSTAATHGTVVINPDGTFTFTPTAGFSGAATFSYKANDGIGNSADATVTVNVGAVNVAPVANPITVTTTTGVAVSGTLTATDANGDPLTFSAGATAATHGTVVINSDGTFTFTPTAGFTGVGTFSFKANDGSLNSADAVGTVVISAAANTAPVVINGTGIAVDGITLNGSVSPLAVDAEGDPLTFSVVSQPTHGTLTLNPDGTFAYNADAGFTGADSFTFKANDGLLDSNIGTFNLTVNASADLFTLNLASTGTIATKLRAVAPLDASASLTAVVPGTSFANATIDATIIDGGDSRKDQLLVVKHSGNVQVRGKKILVDGTQVATLSGGRRGQTLHIAFNSSATVDSVNAVLQRVAAKTRPTSVDTVRTIQLQVNADGATSSATIAATKV